MEEVGTEKPETSLGCLSSQAGLIHQELHPAAIKRYALYHFVHHFVICHFVQALLYIIYI